MPNLKDIRDRIGSVKSTQQITKAMKMVAAAKLRKAQMRMLDTRPYASKLGQVISSLASSYTESNIFMQKVENPEKVLLLVVGSDRGLCGGFNNNLFKEVEIFISSSLSSVKESGNLSLITIGRKATEYFKKRNYSVIEGYPGFFDDIKYEKIVSIMRTVISSYVDRKYDSVFLAYNEFKSVIAQEKTIDQLLPLHIDGSETSTDYLYEPDADEIFERLIPLHLNTQFWKAILESNASEQGARMTAMDNATENAKEIERELKLKYNQARQAAITTEISEIVSGAAALSD